jgi:hypothetical protein
LVVKSKKKLITYSKTEKILLFIPFSVYLQFDNSKQIVLLVQWRFSGTVVMMIFEILNGKRDKISIT